MPSASSALLQSRANERQKFDVEEMFFRGLRLRNGTYKTTYAARMPEIDQYCAALAAANESVAVLDVGISSGVTSLELMRAFDAQRCGVLLTASDLVIDASLLNLGPIAALFDSTGELLQISVGSHGRGRPHDPQESIRRQLLDWGMLGLGALIRAFNPKARPLRLVSAALASRPDVEFVESDLFDFNQTWSNRFWLVRAANVLNLDYFDEQTLRRGLWNLLRYVRPGAYLLLNRTHDSDRSNHGSLLQRASNGEFTVTHRFGHGSEIESLALAEAEKLRGVNVASSGTEPQQA